MRSKTQGERTEATVRLLIETAHVHFSRKGFQQTSIDDIASSAGVTRGAFYHHFDSKLDIFRSVFVDTEKRLADLVLRSANRQSSPWRQLLIGCRAFLDACLDPAVRQIYLLDGPAILGWEAVRAIEAESTLAVLQQGLVAASQAGEIRSVNTEAVAYLVFGALCEAGMVIARSPDPKSSLKAINTELEGMLSGLQARS